MIQDIYPYKLNNQYDNRAVPEAEDYVLCLDRADVLIRKLPGQTELTFPQVKDFPADTTLTYLFCVDQERYFLAGEGSPVPEGCEYMSVHMLRANGFGPKYRIFAAVTGKHLADWYRDTQYCGRCGGKMAHSTTERAMACSRCGYTAYPRIMPAVIVGVTNGNKLLLTKYRQGYGHNALIAGFVEIGETVEETAAREVMEEAGVRIKNIRYYKSQPWGTANDILVGFFCDVDGDTEIHMDTQELKYASWVEREEIVLQPDDFSLTNEMMMMFKNGMI